MEFYRCKKLFLCTRYIDTYLYVSWKGMEIHGILCLLFLMFCRKNVLHDFPWLCWRFAAWRTYFASNLWNSCSSMESLLLSLCCRFLGIFWNYQEITRRYFRGRTWKTMESHAYITFFQHLHYCDLAILKICYCLFENFERNEFWFFVFFLFLFFFVELRGDDWAVMFGFNDFVVIIIVGIVSMETVVTAKCSHFGNRYK